MAHTTLADFLKGTEPYGTNRAKLRAWYEGDEVVKLRREVAELRKRLAECEARLKQGG